MPNKSWAQLFNYMAQEICIKHDNTIKSKNNNQGTPEFPFYVSITYLPGNFTTYLLAPSNLKAN